MDLSASLARIEALARRGDEAAAYAVALDLAEARPASAEAWLWAALLSHEASEAVRHARRAAQIETSERSAAVLRWALDWRARRALPRALGERIALLGGRPRPRTTRRWLPSALALVGTGMALLLLAFLLWPQPTAAERATTEATELWQAGAWEAALARWGEAHALQPDDAATTEALARAHFALSTRALERGQPDEARPHLEAALALMPHEPALQAELQALRAYEAGRAAVAARDWPGAIEALAPLVALDAGYLDAATLLATARAGQQQRAAAGTAQRDQQMGAIQGTLPGALLRDSLVPDAEYSNQPGQEEMPTAPLFANPDNKHIVVSINDQRMYVYEDGALIWSWVASTGEAERPTIPGHYRIQSKFEEARSNVWSLWMPYWQGLYWAGSVENGIHGQVIFDAGGNLWEGYLGTRITFGCVMISDEHAAQLFEWTELGTPVSIRWEWDPSWLPDANGEPIQP